MTAIFFCCHCAAATIFRGEVEYDDIVGDLLPVGWGIEGSKIYCRKCR